MICIARCTIASNLGVDLCPAPGCALDLFQYVNPGPFTQYYARSISRKGSRSSPGFVVPSISQDRHQIEGCKNSRSDRRVNSSGNHDILPAERDVLSSVSEGIC